MKFKTNKIFSAARKKNNFSKTWNGWKGKTRRNAREIRKTFYEYEDGPKPKHYDDPNIIDHENFKQRRDYLLTITIAAHFKNRNQRQRINTWDLMLETQWKSKRDERN